MYNVEIIADSIHKGKRITTMQLTYPRYIHAEFMTHRLFSRNASSSRAIPVERLIKASTENMVFPIRWGKNQSGMQAAMEDLGPDDARYAEELWAEAAQFCAETARDLAKLGLHKQWANRMLEWFGNITVVVTATEWDNFYELRNHPDAQPEIQYLAELMLQAHEESEPNELAMGEWHIPYLSSIDREDVKLEELLQISAARCARTSYFTQEGKVPTIEQDLALYQRLVGSVPLHASPIEHQATPANEEDADDPSYTGNFRGWVQFRKLLEKAS